MTSVSIRRPVTLAVALLLSLSVSPFRSGSADAAQTTTREQALFPTPQEAMKAVVYAAETEDRAALTAILTSESENLLSGDEAQDNQELEEFAAIVQQSAELEEVNDTKFNLMIGNQDWVFLIPIVKTGSVWHFDTPAGMEQILNRRIGENELSTILTCRAYVLAQSEYFTKEDSDQDSTPAYAQRFMSPDGMRNGLYWDTAEGDDPSPLGSLVAAARAEGYGRIPPSKSDGPAQRPEAYHGYYFKILTRQGPHAPGGKYNYIINGKMIAGYALVAYPEEWGNSGVMTFVVNRQGHVYEKDLGPKTSQVAGSMAEYNPDPTWKLVNE